MTDLNRRWLFLKKLAALVFLAECDGLRILPIFIDFEHTKMAIGIINEAGDSIISSNLATNDEYSTLGEIAYKLGLDWGQEKYNNKEFADVFELPENITEQQ